MCKNDFRHYLHLKHDFIQKILLCKIDVPTYQRDRIETRLRHRPQKQ